MKVCFLSHYLDKDGGGPSRSVPILARGMVNVGVDVTLLVLESANMNLHILDGTSVKVQVLPKNIKKRQLEQLIIDGCFDLVHLHMIWVPVYHQVASICRLHNIPYVITPRGTLEPWCYHDRELLKRYKKYLAMALYQRRDLQKAAFVMATAQMEADSVRKLKITSPIAVVPNGIEVDDYPCRSVDTPIKKRVIYLSRIAQKKGIEYLISAWRTIKEKYPKWSVIIVGNGEESYIRELNNKISEAGVSDCMQILPPAFGKEKYKLYVESQLFVLPTHSENFGMVIAEAMSVGLPVITTTGTPWEILQKTNTGWWINLSVESLISALDEALSMPQDKLIEMGQKASSVVRENFEYSYVAKRLKKAYSWVIDGAEKPDYVECR